MASSNSSVVKSFTIALIVFVMLTFVLAVTTYLYFKKADENQQLVDAKQKEASDANTKRLEAEKLRLELVKDVLGFPEEMDNAAILAQKKEAIDDLFGKYLEQPTYVKLTDWLSSSIQEKYKQMVELQMARDTLAAEKAKLVAVKDKEMADVNKSKQTAQADLDKLQADYTKYKTDNTGQKNKLVTDLQVANDQTKRLQRLGDEIAKGKDYLSIERLKNWPANAGPADGGKGAGGESPDERRVALMFEELRDRERTISRLNQVVSQLRVADRGLQRTVLDATPKDDRLDGFDGRILSVNELDRTVLISCGTTVGIRAGLLFNVYDPTDPQPQISAKKAVVEVTAIESDSLVRGRVRQDSTGQPILPGDAVATSLWAPRMALEVVVVGVPQFGGSAEADASRLRQLVERIGGTVAETVTPSTTMVVDAGFPKAKGGDAERKPMNDKMKENRVRQIAEAKQLGIKVLAIEPFLGMLGLQLDAVGANRLPAIVDRLAPPARAGNSGY